MRTPITQDDILMGFAVTWDRTPAMLTEWKKRYPLWANEMEDFAVETIREEHRDDEVE